MKGNYGNSLTFNCAFCFPLSKPSTSRIMRCNIWMVLTLLYMLHTNSFSHNTLTINGCYYNAIPLLLTYIQTNKQTDKLTFQIQGSMIIVSLYQCPLILEREFPVVSLQSQLTMPTILVDLQFYYKPISQVCQQLHPAQLSVTITKPLTWGTLTLKERIATIGFFL